MPIQKRGIGGKVFLTRRRGDAERRECSRRGAEGAEMTCARQRTASVTGQGKRAAGAAGYAPSASPAPLRELISLRVSESPRELMTFDGRSFPTANGKATGPRLRRGGAVCGADTHPPHPASESRRDTRMASSAVVTPSSTSVRATAASGCCLGKGVRGDRLFVAAFVDQPPDGVVDATRFIDAGPPLIAAAVALRTADRLVHGGMDIDAEQRRDGFLALTGRRTPGTVAAPAAARSRRARSRRAGTARPSCRASG